MTVPTKKTRLFMRRDVRRVAFVDKLRQRWIVERAATTLYQLAIARLRDDLDSGALISELERFREQERLHAAMLEQLLGELGHDDPRHEPATAAVNIAAGEMASFVDLMRERQLTTRHVLEILLMAERLDLAGWELLTDLAKEADLDDDYLRSFRAAGREEAAHEHFVRTHLVQLEREMLFSDASARP
jgi:rubrerythrin